jgi:hypothetical protein
MTSISINDIFTIEFILVEARYRIEGIKYLQGKAGVKGGNVQSLDLISAFQV